MAAHPSPRPAGLFRWDKLSDEQARVLRALLGLNARGIDQAVRVTEIAQTAGLGKRQAQHAAKALIEEHHVPIGTSKSSKRPGWYLCATEEELADNHQRFRGAGISMLERARAFRPDGNPHLAEDFYGQQELPLGAQHG